MRFSTFFRLYCEGELTPSCGTEKLLPSVELTMEGELGFPPVLIQSISGKCVTRLLDIHEMVASSYFDRGWQLVS